MFRAPILQIGPPHPHPQLGRCCVSWTRITKGTPSRVSLPLRTLEWGLGSGCPQGSKGAAGSHSPSIAAATRAESRGSNSSGGGVSMVWADASSSPLPSGPVTSRRRPPQLGGPPFSSFLPSPPLFLSYPSAQRTRGVGDEVSSEPPWEGLADQLHPQPPNPNPSPPAVLLVPLFPLSPGEAHSPISEPPPAAKMHNWEEAG